MSGRANLTKATVRSAMRVDHTPKLTAPWYAEVNDGVMLHRYLDDQFIERFVRESHNDQLVGAAHQSWREQDRFGKDTVALRLPIHRTFYVACSEVSCDRLGSPAFDPVKIVSAGLVVRKGSPNRYQTWQVRDGVAIGWRDPYPSDGSDDPDHYRRLLSKKLIEPSRHTPPFSGEQTHPMHAELVQDSQQRNRTLIYGYVPLGGSVEANLVKPDDRQPDSHVNSTIQASGQLAEHEWPFGSWDGVSNEPVCTCEGSLDEVTHNPCDHFQWDSYASMPIRAVKNQGSQPSRAMVGFLRTLMDRYQIFNTSIADNEALRTLCRRVVFNHWPGRPDHGQTLLDYLIYYADELQEYFAQIDQSNRDLAKADPENFVPPSYYPDMPGDPGSLHISEDWAADAREYLLLRAERAEELVESSLPLPRYTQGEGDQYFICTFVRYLDHCGCERVVWGPKSAPFRVVSPLDAQATRPSVIQLPELSDLKKGFTKGVTFLTPKSMADALQSVVPDMEFKKQNKKSHLDACLGFSISFSIPIITICAMILLMIVLNLLNFVFRWLPWAILVLPRRCGRK
ncbi:MAG: hypothetical protein P8X74_17420 [Reinekea sp.]